MYCSFADLSGAGLVSSEANDELGTVKDLYIEARTWQVSYIVIETGSWFSSNQILLTPGHIERLDIKRRRLQSTLDRNTIEKSLPADSVMTEDEAAEARTRKGQWMLPAERTLMHFSALGNFLPPAFIEAEIASDQSERDAGSSSLRSVDELIGYSIAGSDTEFGAVHDLLLDPASWRIVWLSVDTRRWLPGQLVVLSPDWIEDISWDSRHLAVKLSREQVKSAPPLHTIEALERSYEHTLYTHYNMPLM